MLLVFFFSFVKAIGVCFMTVCESSYPSVLAFSFLDEIQREFTTNFQSQDVQRVIRPYSFIEFGKFSLCSYITKVANAETKNLVFMSYIRKSAVTINI